MSFQKFKQLVITLSDLSQPSGILRIINQLQSNLNDCLTPMTNKSQNDSTILTNISLSQGKTNIVNHTLGRQLAGWKIVGQSSQASIWDNQANNKSPNLTLLLLTSANTTVNIEVF